MEIIGNCHLRKEENINMCKDIIIERLSKGNRLSEKLKYGRYWDSHFLGWKKWNNIFTKIRSFEDFIKEQYEKVNNK